MAQRNFLVEGLSGAGKSSVYDELIRRGYHAISTDRAWKLRTGSEWDEQRALSELESPEPDVLFVCGSSRNRDRFLPYFAKVFNLRIDDDTMRRRLAERTNNDYGKQPEELELMLTLNRNDEGPAGSIDIDAVRPLDRVVDEVLRLANCTTSDARPMPWSRRGSVTGHASVSSERIEYGWSGHVLATLLSYLLEQGIDLMHSGRDDVASSEARAGSVFVLTSDHRKRYLARLDPTAFDGAVLRRYYEELNETAAAGVEYAMLDGIAFLRDTLTPLEGATVAVLVIE